MIRGRHGMKATMSLKGYGMNGFNPGVELTTLMKIHHHPRFIHIWL
jgi:hypothetical protein